MEINVEESIIVELDSMGYAIKRIGKPKKGEFVVYIGGFDKIRVCKCGGDDFTKITTIVEEKFKIPDWLIGANVFFLDGWWISRNSAKLPLHQFNQICGLKIPLKEQQY